jgi:hypothetical protein
MGEFVRMPAVLVDAWSLRASPYFSLPPNPNVTCFRESEGAVLNIALEKNDKRYPDV